MLWKDYDRLTKEQQDKIEAANITWKQMEELSFEEILDIIK